MDERHYEIAETVMRAKADEDPVTIYNRWREKTHYRTSGVEDASFLASLVTQFSSSSKELLEILISEHAEVV
jgi:hypothetical protein